MGLPYDTTIFHWCSISLFKGSLEKSIDFPKEKFGLYYFFYNTPFFASKWDIFKFDLKHWVNNSVPGHSDWLMWFLIIICSIFVQSSDWLVATAISHYYLLNFRSKLWLASQQMTWPKFILKSCKRLRELSPEHDSSLLTQLSFCDINKGPWYKFSLIVVV